MEEKMSLFKNKKNVEIDNTSELLKDLDKEIKLLEETQYGKFLELKYKLLKTKKDDRKSKVVTDLIIKCNGEMMPLIHFFLSELSSIGITYKINDSCFENEYNSNSSTLIDMKKSINKIEDKLNEDMEVLGVVRRALDEIKKVK